MEGRDGAYGTIVRYPIDVAERESGDQAGGEQLVDIVRVKVLDWLPVSVMTLTVQEKGTEDGDGDGNGRGANR